METTQEPQQRFAGLCASSELVSFAGDLLYPRVIITTTGSPQSDSWLSPAERQISADLCGKRQRDWRAGRYALKQAAATLLGIEELSRLETWTLSDSAPQITVLHSAEPPHPLTLATSVTHRDGRAAAVVSWEGVRWGVDLERAGGVGEGLGRYFLTPAEHRATRFRDATEIWALKEAAWKALGCSRSLPFAALELQFDRAGDVGAVSLHHTVYPARAEIISCWPGYVLAVLTIAPVPR